MNGGTATERGLLRSSLPRNVAALYVLQLANYLIPIVTLPYLIRVLGAEQYGVMAIAYATVFFMVLFADAGFNTLAARRLANPAIGNAEIGEIFVTTQLIKLLQTFMMFLLLLLLLWVVPGLDSAAPVYLATFPIVLGSLLFPTWLFQGLEIMHFTTLFSVGGRLLATAGIFIVVREPADITLAAFLQASATALSGLLAMPVLYGRLGLRLRTPWRRLAADIKRTVAEARALAPAEFLHDALNNSGVFVLGLFASDAAVGTFAAIEKVARSVASLFQPLTRALFPVLAGLWIRGASCAAKGCRTWAVRIVMLACCVALVLYAAAPAGLELLFGAGWAAHAPLLRILAAWLALHVAGLALGQFWLLARGERSAYARCLAVTGLAQLIATVVGAMTLGAKGLVTGLVCSELLRVLFFAGEIMRRRSEYSPCAS